MRNRILAVLAALALAMTGSLAVVAPAQAAPTITYPDGSVVAGKFIANCPTTPSGKFCIRASTTFGSPSYYWTIVITGCYTIGSPHDNTAQSVHNANASRTVKLYMNPAGGGACTSTVIATIPPQQMAQCNNAWPPIGTLQSWNTAGSPCDNPTASSFLVT